jgi:outer membrane lipoprotein-sorting protein
LYDYKYEGTTYTEDNGFAYVLTFKPKKQNKFSGKLYVSENDYAVLQETIH